MKKLLFILFLLPVFCFAQTNFTPQFKRNIPPDSLIGYSIPGVTGNHWLPDTAWVKKHAGGSGGAFIPLNFLDTVKVHENGLPAIFFQTGSSAAIEVNSHDLSDGRATFKFHAEKGTPQSFELGINTGGSSPTIGFSLRDITRDSTGIFNVFSVAPVTDIITFNTPHILKNVPNGASADSGLAIHGDTLVRVPLASAYTVGDGLKLNTFQFSIDTAVVQRLSPSYINQTASDVMTIHNLNVSSGTVRSKQAIAPGQIGQGHTYQSTNQVQIWNDTGSDYFVDVYTSTNHGLTFTLLSSNVHAVAGAVFITGGSFLLITDHSVSPVLPIVYSNTAGASGTAGGDLGGTYPNPTVNQVNGITKNFYDPTSSIQTQLNGKQATLGFTPENVANKSTTTTLGTSNTLYPTQNAVKAYVDALSSVYQPIGTYLTPTNTQPVSNKTLLPANTVQTPAGTPGTDSVMVKHSGQMRAISAIYYSTGGSTLTRQNITSGTSATVTGGNYLVTIDPSSTIAAYTLTMPASPNDLDVVQVSFGGTLTSGLIVTSLTISANSGQTILDNTPPGNATADNTLKYRYRTSNTTWYREKL